MKLTEQKINLMGLDINYVAGGSGQPVIFMHNGGGFWHSWEHQINHFSKSYQVFGIDWPGFGESQAPEGNITLDLLTELLGAFIRKKELVDPILIGNCIGGSAALNYAYANKDAVAKLLLFNVCPGNLVVRFPIMRRYLIHLNKRPRSKKIFGAILRFSATKTPIKKQFPKILFSNNPDRKSSLFLRYEEKFKTEKQSRSRIQLLYAADTYNLERYCQPENTPEHLLVWAAQNRVTPWEKHGIHFKKALRSKNVAIIENAGHLCMYEAPEAVILLIEDYLKK